MTNNKTVLNLKYYIFLVSLIACLFIHFIAYAENNDDKIAMLENFLAKLDNPIWTKYPFVSKSCTILPGAEFFRPYSRTVGLRWLLKTFTFIQKVTMRGCRCREGYFNPVFSGKSTRICQSDNQNVLEGCCDICRDT